MKFLNLFNIYDQRNFINKKIRKSIAALEKFKLLFNINFLKREKVIMVYDCKVSPGTIGDYFKMVMIARLMHLLKLKVTFVIIAGEFRESWSKRYNNSSSKNIGSSKSLKLHFKFMKHLFSVLSLKRPISYYIMNWKEFQIYKNKKINSKTFILFENRVNKRKPLYTYGQIFLQSLFKSSKQIDKTFLLKSNDIKINLKNKKILKKKYLTIGCRHTSINSSRERNLPDNYFIEILSRLNKLYPQYEKIIVSDKEGCQYFKKISKKHSLQCKFSKDYSKDYLGDGKIILNSLAYFGIRGGGIVEFPVFSNLPFLYVTKYGTLHELEQSKNKNFAWHNEKQIFLVNKDENIFFKLLNNFNLN